MKHRNILMGAILALLVISSCSKDEDEYSGAIETGEITIDGTQYTLGFGEMFSGDYDEILAYGFDIILISDDLDPTAENWGTLNVFMQMEFYSATQSDLQSGRYVFDEAGNGAEGTFGDGVFGEGWDDETWEGTAFYYPTSGTFTINKVGDVYELNFDIKADKHEGSVPLGGDFIEANISIVGQFAGKLKQVYSY